MFFGDNEIDFIRCVQDIENNEIFFPIESESAIEVLQEIHSTKKWERWLDSSGKKDPPPDFYSPDYCLMMEVMRVDDHERKNPKGTVINPHNMHNRELSHKLQECGIIDQFPKSQIHIVGRTDLPYYEDHNYTYYTKSFKRILQKHITKIPLYKRNHPNYKVVFLVFDESSAYFESSSSINRQEECVENHIYSGIPHLFFEDEAFLEVFIDKGIDFLLWFAPYKRFENLDPPIELPKLCVYDLSIDGFRKTKYDENRMVSVEI